MTTTTEVTAPGLCDGCRRGDHSGHRSQLGGICVGCACSVINAPAPPPPSHDEVRLQMAAPMMGALGLGRMLLDPDTLVVEHTSDGRVLVEWDTARLDENGRVVLADADHVATVRMRSSFSVAHEKVGSDG